MPCVLKPEQLPDESALKPGPAVVGKWQGALKGLLGGFPWTNSAPAILGCSIANHIQKQKWEKSAGFPSGCAGSYHRLASFFPRS